jgi:hypothetical protein
MLLSRQQNAGQNNYTTVDNKFFAHSVQFKYLGDTVTNQKLFQKATKVILNSGKVYYHSVESILSSHLLSKNVGIKIYKTIILPVVL